MRIVEQYLQGMGSISESGAGTDELTYYPPLINLFNAVGKMLKPRVKALGNLKDEGGNTLLPQESIERIKKNKNIILLTMEDAYMHKGVVGGYVSSGDKQGEEAANLVLKYLHEGSIKNIESLKKSPNIYMFNAKELVSSRVILSEYIARDALIIGKDVNFIEKNKTLLLNIMAIILPLFVLAAAAYYAINRRKCLGQLKDSAQLERLISKLNFKDTFINNLLSFGKTGYWRLDTDTDEMFISGELLDLLKVDNHVYHDASDLLSYFVHADDKELFEKNLSKVKTRGASLTFNHRMIMPDREVLNVTHMIYSFYEKGSLPIIVGVIKLDGQ